MDHRRTAARVAAALAAASMAWLTAPGTCAAASSAAAGAATAKAVTTLRIEQPSATASLPGTNVSAAYLTIRNDGAQPDRLLSVTTQAAAMAHLHVTSQAGGVNRMRPTDGLQIPAHGSVALKNGGDHIMLMGLPRPLLAGSTIALQLTFQRAGDVKVVVPVVPATGN